MAKRDAYEAQFKLKAISHAEEHGNRAAAREFKINESMVRKWRKMENKLRQVKKTQLSFRGHKARWPELEERLERWIIEQRTSGASVSTVTVRRKAVTLAEEMKIEHFQGGPSWCFRFMKRCHFSIRTRTKVAQQRPADYNEKLASFHSYCSQHIADKLIQPSHITNMDEMPLTFDIPLNHTVEKKGTSTVAMHTTGYEHRNQICSTPVKDSAPPPGPSVNESSDHDRENTDDAFKSRRCSVVRCDSWRRGAQCFSLPADPDKRLEWVQFLFLVNGQRITESSWVDIRVCAEHFTPSCFLQVNPATSIALLNTDAVPSVYRPAEPEVKQETIEPIDADFKLEQLKPHDSPTPGSSALVKDETSTLSAPGSPALSKVSESSESGYCKMLQEIMEKVNLLHKTKKYIVSEKQLLQLFSAECPLCQSKVKTEKLVHGALLVLNQQCLQCSYSKHWKNLSEKSVSAFLDDHQTECLEISLETSLDETATISDKDQTVKEESDHKEEMDESSNTDEVEKSDVNWEPEDKSLILDSDKDYNSSAAHTEESAPKQRELCTECGTFFETRVPHICEYKIKPFSCNICGKRCVSEQALAVHSNIHVRMNTEERPYKCQHCNKGFIYNVSLEIHLKRFHTESENQEKTTNLGGSVGGEPEGDEGTDSLYENVEEDHTAEEEVWTGGGGFKKMRTTGKPIGRPKKDIKDTTVEEEKEQKQDKNTKTAKGRKRKPKSRQSSSEDDEEELCESEESLDLTEDEEKNNEKVTSRQKANEDLDFDPTEMKNRERKKVCKTPKRPRGRPRKKAVC